MSETCRKGSRVIKNIIFDIGNVLVYYRPWEYLKKRYSHEEATFLLAAIFETQEWQELDKGTLTEEEALRIFIARDPEKEHILREMMADFYNIFTPIESSISILKELRRKGYTVLFLSNIPHGIYDFITTTYDFLNEFDGGIASAKVKLMKPDEDIYLHLINTYNIEPKESLFIDDTAQNVKTAGNLGFKTIHLTNPDTLKRDLEMIGV